MATKLLSKHMEKAKSTIAIKVNSYKYTGAVYEALKQFGPIEKMVEIVGIINIPSRYLYIQFSSPNSVTELCRSTRSSVKHNDFVVLPSRILSFNPSNKLGILSSSLFCDVYMIEKQNIWFPKGAKLSEQMTYFYDKSRLTEFEFDLRAFICQQLEDIFSKLIDCRFVPFGSSVTGLASHGSDLDIELQCSGPSKLSETKNKLKVTTIDSESIHGKRQILSRVSNLIQNSGFSRTLEILNARVPIIRFNSDLSGICCDLSVGNCMRKINLSSLLHFYSAIVPGFPILVCSLRKWAKSKNVVVPSPSFSLTNFGLTQLILFYLIKTCGVPPLSNVMDSNDILLPPKKFIDLELGDALVGFFDFYANFDFTKKKLDLVTGMDVPFFSGYSVFLQHPLETVEMNVTRNVKEYELGFFKKACRMAYNDLHTKSPSLNKLFTK